MVGRTGTQRLFGIGVSQTETDKLTKRNPEILQGVHILLRALAT